MKYKAIIYVLAFFLLNSCAKDKGNYDVTPINEVEISALSTEENLNVLMGETLVLKPTLTSLEGTEADYKYRWYMFDDNFNPTIELSDKKDLDVPIIAPLGKHTLVYVVEDRRTGVTASQQQRVTVVSKYGSGIVVLEETPKGGDISHIGLDGHIYRDLFSTANDGEYISSTEAYLKGFQYIQGKWYQKPFLIFLTAKGENTVELDPESYKKLGNFSDMLASPPSGVVELEDILDASIGYIDYCIVDGRGFLSSLGGESLYLERELIGDYHLAPFVITTNLGGDFDSQMTSFIGYDEKNGRFVWHARGGGDLLKTYVPDPSKPAAFDLNNIHKHCIYAGYSNTIGLYNWIMKDESDKMYLYQLFKATTQEAASKYLEVTPSANMDRGKYFASSTSLPHIYYVVDDKVMLYDYVSNTVRTVYQTSSGEIITDLKMSVSRVDDVFSPAIRSTGKIYLATYANNEGKVLEFDIAGSGVLNQPTKVYNGFGKIKSMLYREKM